MTASHPTPVEMPHRSASSHRKLTAQYIVFLPKILRALNIFQGYITSSRKTTTSEAHGLQITFKASEKDIVAEK